MYSCTHTEFLVTLSHSTSECDSSNLHVSVVVVVVVGVNFFCFSTSSHEPLHGFASNFVWMFLGWTPTKFVKTIFHGIMGNFVQFLANS